jgi:hypothetical protein
VSFVSWGYGGTMKVLEWLSDGRRLLAVAIILATLIGAWMFRYETYGIGVHRNRFTGAVCFKSEECWFSSNEILR